MISQIREGKITLEIPIVYGMVISENGEDWLGKEISEITKKYRNALELSGFLYKDSYYKADCEMGTIIIWATLPTNPESYYAPKLGYFTDEEKQREHLNKRKDSL